MVSRDRTLAVICKPQDMNYLFNGMTSAGRSHEQG
jgi:hypothetical protein